MQTVEIPKIQKEVKTANSNAIHYGYVAFKDIELASSLGLDHKVQPSDSPYYRRLPCRQIIPFISIEVSEIDEAKAGVVTYTQSRVLPVKMTPKSAEECATEMENCYQEWGFQVLRPLTGLDEDTALWIFQTIQPFTYKLKDIQNEIDFGALERIAKTESYEAVYGDYIIDLDPLPDNLKETAEKVRQLMSIASEVAVSKGEDIHVNSEVNLTAFLATGQGKRRPDPLDIYVYSERGDKLPSLNARTPEAQQIVTSESSEMVELRRLEYEQKQRELDIRERELKLKETPKNIANSFAAAPKSICSGTNAKGEQCKMNAVDGTEFCKHHTV